MRAGKPPQHRHLGEDEIFTVIDGEFEFFDGESWWLSTKVKLIIPFLAAITVSGTSVSRWGRGDAAAQEIQLAIEYAPNPIFQSGTPENAPAEVFKNFKQKYEPIGTAREAEAIRYAANDTSTRIHLAHTKDKSC